MAIKLTIWNVKGNKETFTMSPNDEQLIVCPARLDEVEKILLKEIEEKEKKAKKKNKK